MQAQSGAPFSKHNLSASIPALVNAWQCHGLYSAPILHVARIVQQQHHPEQTSNATA